MIRILKTPILAIVLAALTLLAGCGDREHGDVQEWMRESSKDLRGHVPDLPSIKPLDIKPFEPGDLISPFSSGKVVSGGIGVSGPSARIGGPPPVNPDAYPMTKAPLESIRFIGTIIVDKEARALVQMEREPVRQVRVGDFLGQNNGRIVEIEPSSAKSSGQLILKERLLDKGVWIDRDTVFPAQDKGDRK
jgi:type IV pilus assembly protein PilP